MNCIKIEFSAEDRARLDALLEGQRQILIALEGKANCAACAQTVGETYAEAIKSTCGAPVPGAVVVPASIPDAAPEVAPAPVPVEESAPAEKPASVSLPEFQKALTLRCAESAEMKAKVRELLNQYAPAASAVPEERRSEVLARLAVL